MHEAPVGQRTPQPPQLFTSSAIAAHVVEKPDEQHRPTLPLEARHDMPLALHAADAHWPFTQKLPAGQLAQLLLGIGERHCGYPNSPAQRLPAGHAAPHWPQAVASCLVSVHRPPQHWPNRADAELPTDTPKAHEPPVAPAGH